jgi:hypothetical protein
LIACRSPRLQAEEVRSFQTSFGGTKVQILAYLDRVSFAPPAGGKKKKEKEIKKK